MEETFILNPNISYLDIVDAVNRKLEQALSVNNSIWVGAFDENGKEIVVSGRIISGALWIINDLLEEIQNLHETLYDMHREMEIIMTNNQTPGRLNPGVYYQTSQQLH